MTKKIIKKNEIEYLGHLARIELSEEEKEKLKKDIEKILEYISKLNEINTENISPTYHVLPLSNVFRDDKIEKSFEREEILSSAPERTEEFFKVPRIIK